MKIKTRCQQEDILQYLRTHESLSQIEAYRLFPAPITRLAVSICALRRKGYNIETISIEGKNCYGNYTCAKYVLHE